MADAAFDTVLIVDDDPIFVDVLSAYFQSRGTRNVLVARDGSEALNQLASDRPAIDLVTCDLNMPKTDGIELLDYLAREGIDTPVLIVSSAHASVVRGADVLAQRQGLNCLGALPKPINIDALDYLLKSYRASVPHTS